VAVRREGDGTALVDQANFLEGLVAAMGAIAAARDADAVLERVRSQAELLFEADAQMVDEDDATTNETTLIVPLRGHAGRIATLRLSRGRPFERWDVMRAAVLADIGARACENARLRGEDRAREAERARLAEQLITAEQDERRRLALFLHDGPVQSLSGIALMLDAAVRSVDEGKLDEAKLVLGNALDRHRDTIRSLRDLSFNIEPVVLRDQGFEPAVVALAESLAIENAVQIDVDVSSAGELAEKAQVALYQIVREALNQAVRRGPPRRIAVSIVRAGDGAVVATIADDGAGERRRASFDAISERARPLSGTVAIHPGEDGGTVVRVEVPPYSTA
jgi:signal transduction histidine kinase